MVNKEEYKSAMGKIKASSEFKARVRSSMEHLNVRKYTYVMKRLIPAFILLVIAAGLYMAPLRGTQNKSGTESRTEDSNADNKSLADDFKITESTTSNTASYRSVIYLYGYAYTSSEWLGYSIYTSKEKYESIKGALLGEVTLDLKGKKYTGTPPNFSSTHDVGTKVYAIKNLKKENAVLVADKDYVSVFYRQSKILPDVKAPINLKISDVFKMISDKPHVSSVELREGYYGSWIRTSQDTKLLSLINKELPNLPILNSSELDPNKIGDRIPINLIFDDGAALNIQVYPDAKCAYVFGGYINISAKLTASIQQLFKQGKQYPSISDLLPFKEDEVCYMHFVNHVTGDDVLCKSPKWSRSSFFGILDYYLVEEVQPGTDIHPVMTASIGKSKNESINIEFYEDKNKQVIVGLGSHYYKPPKGQIVYDELNNFLQNSTDLGLKK